MAKIMYAAGIEKVSGALTKINTKSKHADDQNMFLATHRVAETQSKTCSRAYYRKKNNLPWQSNPALSNETIEQRSIFTHAVQAIKQRKGDLMSISADQAAYNALKREMQSKTGITPSMTVFYWAAAKKYRDASGISVTWPEGAIVLTYAELLEAVNDNRRRQGNF